MATRSTEAVPNEACQPGQVGGTSQDWTGSGLLTGARVRHVPGTGSPWRWFFSGIWLVYLIQPVAQLFHRHDVVWIVGGLVITLAFCGLYLFVLMFSDTRPRLAVYGLGVLAVLAAVACVVYGKNWTPLWIYVASAGGMVLTSVFGSRVAAIGVFVITACYLVCCRITHLDLASTLAVLIPVLLIGLAMIGFRMQLTLMRELAQARETVAKLATNEERLRLARDMHDLTGQSLSMITLKSELAARLLGRLPESAERDRVRDEIDEVASVSRQTLRDIREAISGYRRPTLAIEIITARAALASAAIAARLLGRLPESADRDRVRDEIDEVASVSRQTLRDIREAISGYRRPTLAVEIITARAALASAGIAARDDADLTLLSGTFDPDTEAALAWCLREAVTNVVRHSAAKNCYISLSHRAGSMSLTVRDDGQGHAPGDGCGTEPPGTGPLPPAPGGRATGTGLHGMAERLSAVGGSLELRPDMRPGFSLVATVPATPQTSTASATEVTSSRT